MESPFESAAKTYGKGAQRSKPLIRFDGTKLVLADHMLPNTSVKVVSILGKARMGKSSFLNTFVSKYVKEDSVIFATQDGIEHCTLGIDYYYIAEENVLLLDSQGLASGDARHDPALLLFIYLISNVIVFNDTRLLQNEALRLIEPICTFTQYLDVDAFDKPSLIFRLSDGKQVKDPKKNLENVMAHHEDQYNSIRESIENVFVQPVSIVKTENPRDEEEGYLATNKYLDLLSRKENGFDDAIMYIMNILHPLQLKTDILTRITSIVDRINNNEHIKLEKLDVVALTHKNDVLQWLNTVPSELKSEIKVDSTQATFEQNVVTRQAQVKKLKNEFMKRFRNITDTIKKEHKQKLYAELDDPIERAKEKAQSKAQLYAKEQGLLNLEKSRYLGNIMDAGCSEDNSSLLEKYLGAYQAFQKACSALYEPVRALYDSWVLGINKEMVLAVEKAREVSKEERKGVEDECTRLKDTFYEWVTECISKSEASILLETNSSFLSRMRSERIGELKVFIAEKVHKQNIELSIHGGHLTTKMLTQPNDVGVKYSLVADLFTQFTFALSELPTSTLEELLKEKKELLLAETLLLDPIRAKEVYLANTDIQFVHDSVLLNTMIRNDISSYIDVHELPYMSLTTWKRVYEPLYEKAMAILIDDGICAADTQFSKFVVECPEEGSNIVKITMPSNQESRYDDNVCEFFLRALKKVYCREIVKGTVFPVAIDLKPVAVDISDTESTSQCSVDTTAVDIRVQNTTDVKEDPVLRDLVKKIIPTKKSITIETKQPVAPNPMHPHPLRSIHTFPPRSIMCSKCNAFITTMNPPHSCDKCNYHECKKCFAAH